jgi:hypothetical protein
MGEHLGSVGQHASAAECHAGSSHRTALKRLGESFRPIRVRDAVVVGEAHERAARVFDACVPRRRRPTAGPSDQPRARMEADNFVDFADRK